jgi:hypothetical protein
LFIFQLRLGDAIEWDTAPTFAALRNIQHAALRPKREEAAHGALMPCATTAIRTGKA